jgi:hypothetical protein
MNIKNQKDLKKRITGFFNTLSIENLSALLEYGIPIRTGTVTELRKNNFNDFPAPVFFLSTGRCGTKWFAKLLSLKNELKVFHEPAPNLAEQGAFAYQLLKSETNFQKDQIIRCLQEIYLAGRETPIRYCYKTNRRMVETNHYITFFAPALEKLFPKARFVHVYRHPGEFVRSAIRRDWYGKDNLKHPLPIVPLENEFDPDSWKAAGQIAKAAWLWNETNTFVAQFVKASDQKKHFSFNFNKLNLENIKALISFLEINIKDREIEKILRNKANVQRKGSFEEYDEWDKHAREELIAHCGQLAQSYGYEL